LVTKITIKKGLSYAQVVDSEQKENRRMHVALAFVVALWALIAGLLLFFIFLGLSLSKASLQIQVAIVIGTIAILSILTFRLYRGVVANLAKVRTGKEVLVGAIGIATTDLRPTGEVRVKGEFWQAVAKEGWIEKDREVEVVGMEGLVLTVRMVKEKA
jgi:membrane-bound serine protease (ClpP class)